MPAYSNTFLVKRLWQILITGTLVMFSVLLYFGGQIYQQAPPIPDRYETGSGHALYTRADIELVGIVRSISILIHADGPKVSKCICSAGTFCCSSAA